MSAEFAELVQAATQAGRPFDVAPVLVVVRGGSAAVPTPRVAAGRKHPLQAQAPVAPVVELSASVAGLAPGERAATMAHELSHLLRVQEGRRPPVARWQIAAVYAAGLLAAVGALGVVFGGGGVTGLVAAVLALGGLSGMWLLLQLFRRREETEVDLTAARVFGQVLTAAGVARLELAEGRWSRWVPTVVRTHPHPRRRRAAQLR